ncbi:MAG: aminotransferase class I/II-fold pyridoxal phosphate-dependent enzyme [Candidatus Dormiibacterota bacterium]
MQTATMGGIASMVSRAARSRTEARAAKPRDPLLVISGNRAGAISGSVERALLAGTLHPGQSLPTVRRLAEHLRVSPTTVAAAYRDLQLRGYITAAGRKGTHVSARPPLTASAHTAVPEGVLDLATGSPDPAFLPDLRQTALGLALPQHLYGTPCDESGLLRLAAEGFVRDGVSPDFLTVVGGGMAGVERTLEAHLRPGDRIALEDPSYHVVHDLALAMGLVPEPVPIDQSGFLPDAFEEALHHQVAAVVVTPRAQNPTGAALDAARARTLRGLLAKRPDVLLVEDDHSGPVAGASLHTLTTTHGREHWAIIRSVSKWLGPDLRLAVMSGDPGTISRIEGRQALGTGWVSHVLQSLVVALAADPSVLQGVEQAAAAYTARRHALVNELGRRGVTAWGRSGLNVWVPVDDETASAQALLDAGYAVARGDQFRLRTRPGIRIAIGRMDIADAPRIADTLTQPNLRRPQVRLG